MILPDLDPLPTSWLSDGPQVYLIDQRRKPKAADIDTVGLLQVAAMVYDQLERPALIWDFARHYPTTPWRVINAKLRRLGLAGLLEGCDCGCRGDWVLTPNGQTTLAMSKPTNPTVHTHHQR